MKLDTSLLKENLQELYLLQDKTSLTSNFSKTRIYDSTKGLGKVWRIIHLFISLFVSKNYEKKCVETTLKKISLSYKQAIALTQETLERYKKLLDNNTLSENHDDELNILEKKITILHKCYLPFFENFFPTHPLVSKSKKYQQLIDLNSYLIRKNLIPIPRSILKALLQEENEIPKDKMITLRSWIHGINARSKKINPKYFHEALKTFLNDSEEQALKLEYILHKKNCKILTQEESSHIKWRNSLKKGFILKNTSSNQIILGNQIETSSQFSLYFQENNPSQEILIGINESLLKIKKMQSDSYRGIVPLRKWIFIDPAGRWALLESLQDHPPSSNLNDFSYLIEMLKKLIQCIGAETHFKPHLIKWNKTGQIRIDLSSIAINEPLSPLEFDDVELLIYKIANKNLSLYSHLIEKTQLHKHIISYYFSTIFEKTMRSEELNVFKLAQIREIYSKELTQSGKRFQKTILLSRNKFLTHLKNQKEYNENNEIEKIIHRYKKLKTFSLLGKNEGKEIYQHLFIS